MALVIVERFEKEVDAEVLSEDSFDVDFDGELMLQLTKSCDDFYRVTNAMNGYGNNCFDEYKNSKVEIIF